MATIYVKDELRAAVEGASGGKQTVMYTAAGQPSIMNVIPKFNLEDLGASLGAGVHPAFIVGGVEKSELFIGAYQGIIKNGELISLAGVDPTASRNHDQFVTAARAAGPGWHVMTNAEYAAIALWCLKNGFQPRGNTGYGRSHEAVHETARRQDGGAPGNADGTARTLTGSGPASWRHDNTPNGIADLCGNVWEWSPGMRLMDGEIQIIPNNDAALNATDMSRSAAAWRAIRASDGALVAPGTPGTLIYDGSTPTGGAPVISDVITNRHGVIGDDSNEGNSSSVGFKDLKIKDGMTVPAIARVLGLAPVANEAMKADRLYVRNFGERIPYRGDYWSYGSNAGVFALNLTSSRTGFSTGVGARPAFVI